MMQATTTTHEDAWDQIPWLINDTLGEAEAAAVRAHVATCKECQAEFTHQQRINDVVQEFEAPIPNPALALESISHRLTPPKPQNGLFTWIVMMAQRAAAPRGLALGGALAAAAMIIVFGLSAFEPRFETLTTPEVVAEGVEIRVRYDSDANAADIIALMAEAGATDITGPSETGLLRGMVADPIAQEVVERLKSDPRVIFIAKDD